MKNIFRKDTRLIGDKASKEWFLNLLFGAHKWDALNNTPVVLFGAGSLGEQLFLILKQYGVTPVCFCDNDVSKKGRLYCGIPVISFSELTTSHKNSLIVIATDKYREPVTKQLLGNGFSADRVLCKESDNSTKLVFLYSVIISREPKLVERNLIIEIIDKLFKKQGFIKNPLINYLLNEMSYKKSQVFWKNQKNWRMINAMPERAIKQEMFLREKFIPLLNKDSIVCDLACACGDFSFIIAPYVKKVEGYDLSSQLIEEATKTAKDNNIQNVSFKQADAIELEFDKIYDHFLVYGLLTCLFSDQDILKIVKKIKDAIKPDGYMILKDNLTMNNQDILYSTGDYAARYTSKAKYMKLFESNGFEFVETTELDSCSTIKIENNDKLKCLSFSAIVQRQALNADYAQKENR
jgi:2-polyprenyl-3-methyl-5-hydroxy-6-metoxy-1,4-benzoquinol methylase